MLKVFKRVWIHGILIPFFLVMGCAFYLTGCGSKSQQTNNPLADSHDIFEGVAAISKLEASGYEVRRIKNGYRLIFKQTAPREITTKDGTQVTGRVTVEEFDVEIIKGLPRQPLRDTDMSCWVDRDGNMWLAVVKRIVIHNPR